jgi:hypothetical protein
MSEPAVWHASLALASFHRDTIMAPDQYDQKKQSELVLKHYIKSISYLQDHFKAKNRTSYRISLVACILYASLDLLRGHIQHAKLHLCNGVSILGEMRLLCTNDHDDVQEILNRSEVDEQLSEAYARLQFQFRLYPNDRYDHRSASGGLDEER